VAPVGVNEIHQGSIMNGNIFNRLPALLALSAACVAFTAVESEAQRTYGKVTSRLATAKFSLMKGWWGSDHDQTTPVNFKYFKALATTYGVSMDTFNLTSSTAPLTQANLDKYDVMVWYNVYRMYEHFDTATGNRIQRWYENGNKGLACIHQCVRSSNTPAGIKWNWWIDMMGKDYTDFAASGVSGPVFVDAEGLNTIYGDSSGLTPRQKFTWNDEWYIYAANTRGTPGTQMVWTTADSLFSGSYKKTMGNDHPLLWVRNYGGGRFVLNSMYHSTALATATGALQAFADSSYIGQLRFLAGYDGCKDSNYVEYNPKATHQPAGACVNPTFIQVASAENRVDKVRLDDFKITFSQPGSHSVEIYNMRGGKVASHRGEGSREYRFAQIREPGVYHVRIMTAGMKVPSNRRIILL
jgi:hypothetical protein